MGNRAISLVGWIVACVCPVAAIGSEPAAGTIIKSLDFPATKFVLDPNRPILYATSLTRNSIGLFDTNSLQMTDELPVGKKPYGLAMSPDGRKVYIANSGENSVSMLDTQTHQVNTLGLQFSPLDVACGFDNRLWMIQQSDNYSGDYIDQVDAMTGLSTGKSPSNLIVHDGMLEMSPAQRKLYYGNSGVSPASLCEIDVTGQIPQILWEDPFGSLGDGGKNLAFSHDCAMLAFVTGSGIPSRVSCCNTPILRTSDKSILEVLENGGIPSRTYIQSG